MTNIRIGGEALNPAKFYCLVTGDYMARGKLGFVSLHAISAGGTAKEIVSADNGLQIYELIFRYFTAPEEFASAADDDDGIDDNISTSTVSPSDTTCDGKSNTGPLLNEIMTTTSSSSFSSPSSAFSLYHSVASSDSPKTEVEAKTETLSTLQFSFDKNLDEDLDGNLNELDEIRNSLNPEKKKVKKNLRCISPRIESRIRIIDFGIDDVDDDGNCVGEN